MIISRLLVIATVTVSLLFFVYLKTSANTPPCGNTIILGVDTTGSRFSFTACISKVGNKIYSKVNYTNASADFIYIDIRDDTIGKTLTRGAPGEYRGLPGSGSGTRQGPSINFVHGHSYHAYAEDVLDTRSGWSFAESNSPELTP